MPRSARMSAAQWSGILAAFELPGFHKTFHNATSLGCPALTPDQIAFMGAFGPVTADPHSNTARNMCVFHVAQGCPPQIMKQGVVYTQLPAGSEPRGRAPYRSRTQARAEHYIAANQSGWAKMATER